MTVNDAGTDAPSGFDSVFLIVNVPRSRVIEFWTVMMNVPLVELITIDVGLYVGAAHVKPLIAAGATSVTVQEFPVGIPVTVACVLVVTVLVPVKPVPQL